MAEKRDYYEILGLQKGATEDEIKKAFRKKARENHPDLHPDDPSYVEKFQEINEANEVLSDPEKRARAIVKAVTNYNDPKILAELSEDLGEAMVGINADEIKVLLAERGV